MNSSRRSLAQQQRRARKKEAQESELSRRGIVQQQRHLHEREAPGNEPSRRSIAQQQRRAREREICENEPGLRVIAQRDRRELERMENLADTPNKRSIAQQSRRENERSKRARIQENVRHYLGHMDSECSYCSALHWLDERLTVSSKTNPKFGKCCKQGKVILPTLLDPPLHLRRLFESQDEQSKEFRTNIH
ncbi:23625_t:CDS:1 [Cetraspora pellucida]|uniref:23625_t:CDS:1 n=1 Tax=Cetraspora pellucida TaxID=1433469 RepID=A0A9N9K7Q3_9GLOM|nr:23625_t:CDS:1 [Cetraspora pellucida]